MISRNPEHTEIVRMAGPLAPVMLAMGIDPINDVEKLNINYNLYEQAGKQVDAIYSSVRDAADDLARLRDEVGNRWQGNAADRFDRYAEKVVSAGGTEKGLIDLQDQASEEFFGDIKKTVQEAHDAIMDALSGLLTLGAPVAGLAVEIERMISGTGDAPEIPIPTDIFGVVEVVLKAIAKLVELPRKFDEAKYNGEFGTYALRDVADFRISTDHSEGAVPTGLDGNEKDPNAWQTQ